MGVTEKARSARRWLSRFKHVGRDLGKSGQALIRGVMTNSTSLLWNEVIDAMLPGKASKLR